MSSPVYVARIVPISDRPTEIRCREGIVHERFTEWSFYHQRKDVAGIEVRWQHRNKPVRVGHVTALSPSDGWWLASFELDHTPVAGYAADTISAGRRGVSIEFDPIKDTWSRTELRWVSRDVARLVAVSIGINRGDYPDAKIIEILPARAATPRAHRDTSGVLRREHTGRILGVR